MGCGGAKMADVMEGREEEMKVVRNSEKSMHGSNLQQDKHQDEFVAQEINVMSSPDRSKASTPERQHDEDDVINESPATALDPFEREERLRQRVLSVTSLVNEDFERTRKFSMPKLSDDSYLGLDDTHDLSQSQNFFSFDQASNPAADIDEVLNAIGNEKSVQITGIKVDEHGLGLLHRFVSKGSVDSVTLARCELDDEMVKKIAGMLQSSEWRKLRSLSLDGNRAISDEGAKSLARVLEHNKSLEDLSLWGTGVGDVGAGALAVALEQNCTLRNLWLGECENIQDEGALALLASLESNQTLQQLALVCTAVSEDLQNKIEGIVQAERI
mmetsp:Transcript_23919/g.53597  ORF Transcript_23919/g.53597 Transcript_23919/m.53597 type:complete len:329 (-) Transcript_23919:112-1098(-)